jgi:hypothetical protein
MNPLINTISNVIRLSFLATGYCYVNDLTNSIKKIVQLKNVRIYCGIFVQMPLSIFIFQKTNQAYPGYSPPKNY